MMPLVNTRSEISDAASAALQVGNARQKEFLKDSRNTVTREKTYLHRFCFDVYSAAAQQGYAMTVLTSEVDRDGFDIILGDGDLERRVQLKVRFGRTAKWEIRRRFLLPSPWASEALGFAQGQRGSGHNGAVVVIDIEEPSLRVSYLMADAFTLAVQANGWMPHKKRTNQSSAENLRRELVQDRLTVSLKRSLMVKAKGPAELLALLQLNSIRDSSWVSMLTNANWAAETCGVQETAVREAFKTLVTF
jgi:hypothetical protein